MYTQGWPFHYVKPSSIVQMMGSDPVMQEIWQDDRDNNNSNTTFTSFRSSEKWYQPVICLGNRVAFIGDHFYYEKMIICDIDNGETIFFVRSLERIGNDLLLSCNICVSNDEERLFVMVTSDYHLTVNRHNVSQIVKYNCIPDPTCKFTTFFTHSCCN